MEEKEEEKEREEQAWLWSESFSEKGRTYSGEGKKVSCQGSVKEGKHLSRRGRRRAGSTQ